MADQNKDRLKFDGEGFSEEPFSPEELAKQRHRNHFFDRHFLSPDDFLESTSLTWLSRVAKSAKPAIAFFIAVSSVGGAILVAQQLDWWPK